jgi:hypothetical protein
MRQIGIFGFFLIGILTDISSQTIGTVGDLIYLDTLEVSPQHSWITIDNPDANVWQIGNPEKIFFNAAHNGIRSIITDSVEYYPNNCNDYFYITIPCSQNFWGEGILSFYHKFDTDTLTDGGIIEVSYDNGFSWINVLNDSNHISVNFVGLYEDTLKGGEFGFSGRSDNWQYVELYWRWIGLTKSTTVDIDTPLIRFRFVSDEINTNKEGWMIDDIVFRGYSLNDAIDQGQKMQTAIFPNPTHGVINFETKNDKFKHIIIIVYNMSGRFIGIKQIINNQADLYDIGSGIYMYKIIGDNRIISIGKLLKY